MFLKKKKKYSCIFCSDMNETSKKIIFYCRECKKIREHIRLYGLTSILQHIEKPSAPPY